MNVSRLVFLAGLCLGSLAAEASTEGACAGEGCLGKAASGSILLQKVSAEATDFGIVEEGSAEDAANAVKEAGETALKPHWPCDNMPDWMVKWIVGHTKKEIEKVDGRVKKCMRRRSYVLGLIKKKLEHYKKCIGKYGSFVENSVSEMAEDGADLPEELDQPHHLINSVSEMFEDMPEQLYQLGELIDSESLESEAEDEVQRPGELMIPCDKIKKENSEMVIRAVKVIIGKISKKIDECKEKEKKKRDDLEKKLEHYEECL